MMEEKISIIIPFYNMEKYLSRCIQSILNQTYHNYEVFLVDDGSDDDSKKICESIIEKDERFFIISTKKQGVSFARNMALEKITGEWFAFIDADDWLEEDYLEILLKNALQSRSSISACEFVRDRVYTTEMSSGANEVVTFQSSMACIHSFICSVNSMQGMVWNKLYKRDTFGDVRFDTNLKVNEDCWYTYEVMKKCEKACLTHKKLYHWFIREDSACHQRVKKADFSAANVFIRLFEELKEKGDEEIILRLKRNYVLAVLKTIWNMKYENTAEVAEARKRCKLWKENVWKFFDGKVKIKYFLTIKMPWILKVIKR